MPRKRVAPTEASPIITMSGMPPVPKFSDRGVIMRVMSDGHPSSVRTVVPTGIDVIDNYLLVNGGIALGRIYELSGPETSGKTTFGAHLIAAFQRAGGIGLVLENEEAFDGARYEQMGVNTDLAHIGRAPTIESVFSTAGKWALDMRASGFKGPLTCVWDTLAATPTIKELAAGLTPKEVKEREMAAETEDDGDDSDDGVGKGDKKGKAGMDDRAKVISGGLRKLPKILVDTQMALVVLNQVRDNIGVMFGDKMMSPGGRALRHHTSVRLRYYGVGKSISDDDTRGQQNKLWVLKNKLGDSMRKNASTRLLFGQGYDNDWMTLTHAKEMRLVPQDAKGAEGLALAKAALAARGWGAR